MRRTDDQRGLAEAVADLAGKHAASLRDVIDTELGYAPELWAEMVAMGLPGIAIDERHGGAGGSTADLAVALEELGRWLLPSPLFASATLAVPLLRLSGDEAAMQRWLPGIAAGELRATAAHPEITDVSDSGGRLTGTLRRVLDAAVADLILVPAAGGLFAVETGRDGVRTETGPALDPTRRTATVHLAGVAALPVTAGPEAVSAARDTARVLLAAEQLGGAQRCLDMAVQYAKGRVQFGRPIGSFQAIKHLCADMYSDIACARALLSDALGGDESPATVPMVAASASDAFVRAAERTMQIHGGISYTWEHDCHLYLRRARASERLLGTVRSSYDEIARTLPL